MGSQTGASSNRSVASGMQQNAKTQTAIGIANAAEKSAQKKLGIQKTVAGPVKGASSSVTGYMATNTGGNQMYGSLYNQARNQYLADQGMGTMTNGSFMPGVQTDKGLVFTSANRDAFNRTKSKDIPLSRQMYDSQQRFTAGIAAVAALAGVPVMPSILYTKSRTPYQSYVDKREGGVFSYTNFSEPNRDTNKKSNEKTEMAAPVGNNIVNKETKRKNYLASLKTSGSLEGDRKFITGSQRGFGGTYSV